MPITSSNPFKGRHFPGEVILVYVRWYLRDLYGELQNWAERDAG